MVRHHVLRQKKKKTAAIFSNSSKVMNEWKRFSQPANVWALSWHWDVEMVSNDLWPLWSEASDHQSFSSAQPAGLSRIRYCHKYKSRLPAGWWHKFLHYLRLIHIIKLNGVQSVAKIYYIGSNQEFSTKITITCDNSLKKWYLGSTQM